MTIQLEFAARVAALTLFAASLAAGSIPGVSHAAEPTGEELCHGQRRSVVVIDTAAHLLALCRGARADRVFAVAIGSGGVDKRREGDAKTPLGTYRLGRPRASSAGFHRFIHVGYPTAAQRRQGFTGSAIGIHGPPRGVPRGSVAYDWTIGCIAVDRDEYIEAIEAWVNRRRARRVILR